MQVWTRTAFLVMMATSSKSREGVALTEGSGSSLGGKIKRRLRGGRTSRGNNEQLQWKQPGKTCVFHTPPPPFESDNEYYRDNKTPFGAILRGESPARVFAETATLLAFEDRSPQADLHALIIPKREIGSVFDLRSSDLPMLYEMKVMADELVADSSAKFVFHVPPFNSVQHLHLHVLSPVHSMSIVGRLKYWYETRWCASWESVVTRLEQEVSAVPYERPPKY
jgi:diadenosine tetraphosphate (Ap4A) HIT family hydrolase